MQVELVKQMSVLQHEKEHLMKENRVLSRFLLIACFILLFVAVCSMLTTILPFAERIFVNECMVMFAVLPFFRAYYLWLYQTKRKRDNLKMEAPRD